MRHHWPVHRCHRPFANQVEGKFVGDWNKNPGAASQTLLTGGISVSVAELHSRGSNPVLMTSWICLLSTRSYILVFLN